MTDGTDRGKLPGRVRLRDSLQVKLFLPVFVGLALLISLQAKTVGESNHDNLLRQNQDLLRVDASKLADDLYGLLHESGHDLAHMQDMLGRAKSLGGVPLAGKRYALLSPGGVVRAEIVSPSARAPSVTPPSRPDLAARSTGFPHSDPSWLSFVSPLTVHTTSCSKCHDERAAGWIMVSTSRADLLASAEAIRQVGILTALVVIAVFGLTVWLLVAIHVRRPLTSMAAVMSEVTSGSFSTRCRPGTRDEIGLLGERLNQMVDRLETFDRDLRAANATIMERAERMVNMGEMASRLAHEIRNPLAGIESVVSLLREDLAEDDPDRKILGETLHQIHRIDGTISDLLLFARPHEPKLTVEKVDRLVRDAVRFLRQFGTDQKHEILYEPAGEALFVRVDVDQIGQALLNVLLNALQIMEKPGTVSIRVACGNAGNVEIRVSDTGGGIPEESRPHVFDAFYTTRPKGTGLGLAISRTTLRRHGGDLTIARTGPDGTEFVLTLPAVEAR